VDAVFLDVDIPEEYEHAIEVNAEFFQESAAPVEQISLAVAMEAVDAAEEYARRMGHKISIAILDGTGAPIVIRRMDGAPAHTVDLAIGKAYTATVYYVTTDGLAAASRRSHFPSLRMFSKGRVMAAAGGIPVAGPPGAEFELMGGIGVAGSSSDASDQLCSRAAEMVMLQAHGQHGDGHH
jgi:uncharacterized protein GlcG (DUF336 family)